MHMICKFLVTSVQLSRRRHPHITQKHLRWVTRAGPQYRDNQERRTALQEVTKRPCSSSTDPQERTVYALYVHLPCHAEQNRNCERHPAASLQGSSSHVRKGSTSTCSRSHSKCRIVSGASRLRRTLWIGLPAIIWLDTILHRTSSISPRTRILTEMVSICNQCLYSEG